MKIQFASLSMLAILVALFAVGCGPAKPPQAAQPTINAPAKQTWLNESKVVAYVLPNDGPYYDIKWAGARSRLESLGYQAQKYSCGAYKNLKVQTDIVEDLIQKKVAGIILHPVDGPALVPLVERAVDAGIPVVAENVDIPTPKLPGSVQLANAQNGWELGMALARDLGGKGKVVALIGPSGLDVTDIMWKNVKEYLARFPQIQIVREEYLPVNAPAGLKTMETILVANKDLNGVYAWFVEVAIGAAQAVKNAGYKPDQIKMVCMHHGAQGEALMREGYISSMLVGEPKLMGETSAEVLDAIRRGLDRPTRVTLRNILLDRASVDFVDKRKLTLDNAP
jgi:ABC-type sugar transport system substrate-binding protein